MLMQGKMNSCKAERVAIRKPPYHFLHLVIGSSTSAPLQCVVDGSSPFCAQTLVRAVIHGWVSHNLVRSMVPSGDPRSAQALLRTSQLVRSGISHKDRQLFEHTPYNKSNKSTVSKYIQAPQHLLRYLQLRSTCKLYAASRCIHKYISRPNTSSLPSNPLVYQEMVDMVGLQAILNRAAVQ